MQNLCFGSNQEVLHLAHCRCVFFAEIMLSLVLLSQIRSRFQNNGEVNLPILQITFPQESLHGDKSQSEKCWVGQLKVKLKIRDWKTRVLALTIANGGQAVACMGEKQFNGVSTLLCTWKGRASPVCMGSWTKQCVVNDGDWAWKKLQDPTASCPKSNSLQVLLKNYELCMQPDNYWCRFHCQWRHQLIFKEKI